MLAPRAAGLGFREEIAADLLRFPNAVDFVEVVAESCYVKPAARREAKAVAEIWPVVPHGVKLSLGAAEGIDPARARALGALAKDLRAPVISEHVAFVRSGQREIGHLTALPFTRTAIAVVCRNVDRARRHLPDVPLLLENVAWTFQWPESEMAEGDFYSEIATRTGCSLLLDVGNLYANAINSGKNPITFAESFPLNRIGMIHLAGGILEHAFYFDDHAHAVADDVFALLQSVLAKTGPVPILIERDALFPPFCELRSEVDRCRELLAEAPVIRHTPPIAPDASAYVSVPEIAALERAQNHVAKLLVDLDLPDDQRFDRHAIERSRAILHRKRVDEALPLLSYLAPFRAHVEHIAHQVVAQKARPPRLAAIADALEIARRATAIESLAIAAERDLLSLETRFHSDPITKVVRPRSAPFVRVRQMASGAKVFAFKGFGPHARVFFHERKSARS
ncbi:MAG: DUF692 domain-containing protein [Polyangiaceae bacterium]|nr:DUF692 domain-containing protein [Polyangiaceae bacterium]